MNRITAYFSHTIRGKKGKNASDEELEANCRKAMKAALWIRENVPEIDLYVPAEHEDFVHISYKDKYLTESQILEIDCKILEKRDFHIVYEVDRWLGGGIAVEIAAARKKGMLIFYVQNLDEVTAAALKVIVKDLLSKEKTRGKK